MVETKLFQKKVDKDLFDRVNEIYNSLGTSISEAFIMFLRKSEEVNGLPFELKKQERFIREDNLNHFILQNSNIRALDISNEKDVAEFFDD